MTPVPDDVDGELERLERDEARADQLDAFVMGHAGALGLAEDLALELLPSASALADLGLTAEGAMLTAELGPLAAPILGAERAFKALLVAKLQARLIALTQPPKGGP